MLKLDLTTFKFKHCEHCKNCERYGEGLSIRCPYLLSCIIDKGPGSRPLYFEGITELDNKYADLLHEYVNLIRHLGFNIEI